MYNIPEEVGPQELELAFFPNNTLLFYAALGNIRCFRQLYYNIGLLEHMLS